MIYKAEAEFKTREKAFLKKGSLEVISSLPFEQYRRDVADMHEGLVFVQERKVEFIALFDGDVQVFNKSHDGSYVLENNGEWPAPYLEGEEWHCGICRRAMSDLFMTDRSMYYSCCDQCAMEKEALEG